MRILLDTHVLIWAIGETSKLKEATLASLSSRDNAIYFSPISIFEIAVKSARRRSDFRAPPEEVLSAAVAAGFEELAFQSRMTLAVVDLPLVHHDPFDRLLMCQAIVSSCSLYTADKALLAYGAPTVAA